jgi:2-dehydro-3-deoxygluconokinase
MTGAHPRPQLAVLGECMLELSPAGDGHFRLGVAGDTYNTAVAAAQLGIDVEYLTALGHDAHSDYILAAAASFGVGASAVQRSEHLQPGLYLIDNDAQGERNFSYWRRDSAAHQTLREPALLLPLLETAASTAHFYLSGITLALCEEHGRQALYTWLADYRAAGGKVIYDGNYRAPLWKQLDTAREVHRQMLAHTDIFLPGLDDELVLHGLSDKSALTDILAGCAIDEVVLKDGAQEVTVFVHGQKHSLPVLRAETMVDASGAGDAFNGAYIAARIAGRDIPTAVAGACLVASKHIQHRGAILPNDCWPALKQEFDAQV